MLSATFAACIFLPTTCRGTLPRLIASRKRGAGVWRLLTLVAARTEELSHPVKQHSKDISKCRCHGALGGPFEVVGSLSSSLRRSGRACHGCGASTRSRRSWTIASPRRGRSGAAPSASHSRRRSTPGRRPCCTSKTSSTKSSPCRGPGWPWSPSLPQSQSPPRASIATSACAWSK